MSKNATAQTSTPYLVSENKQLKRDGVKLMLLIEQLQGELAIARTQIDSCDELIQSYEFLLERCNDIYANYDALVAEKNRYIGLDAQEIKLLKQRAKLLRVKLIATGVAVPVAAGGAGVVLTYLILTFKK